MEPIERASKLRQEADFILHQVKVYDILRPHGTIVPTGSYFLDVMVYPDIDLYFSKVSIDQLFDIGGQLAKSDMVFRVEFEKSNEPRLPIPSITRRPISEATNRIRRLGPSVED